MPSERATSLDQERSEILDEQYSSSDRTGSETLPSSPIEGPAGERRLSTRSQAQWATSDLSLRDDPSD